MGHTWNRQGNRNWPEKLIFDLCSIIGITLKCAGFVTSHLQQVSRREHRWNFQKSWEEGVSISYATKMLYGGQPQKSVAYNSKYLFSSRVYGVHLIWVGLGSSWLGLLPCLGVRYLLVDPGWPWLEWLGYPGSGPYFSHPHPEASGPAWACPSHDNDNEQVWANLIAQQLWASNCDIFAIILLAKDPCGWAESQGRSVLGTNG